MDSEAENMRLRSAVNAANEELCREQDVRKALEQECETLRAEVGRLQLSVEKLERERKWIPVTPETMPEPTGERKWYQVTDGHRADHALVLPNGSFMGHSLQFSQVKFYREIGPLPTPPENP